MNTTETSPFAAFQPLLSTSSRIAVALVVAGVLALASIGAQRASHQAVQTAAESFSGHPAHVQATLAPVQIVVRRANTDAKRI
ncbi:MAG: hypothetical protein JWQ07_1562 [Ramlibacter sp.]|nr:hypothetical protein [Ramlibacter sp.]